MPNRIGKPELTATEKKVFKHLENGLSRKMISEKLAMSVNTVNSHVKNVYLKLEVHNITGALKVISKRR